jgi:hypothetical protein
MTRLYLVRRQLENFLGPYTAKQVEEQYDSLTFGSADEISGNCGPWVSFEQKSKLKEFYPEIYSLMSPKLHYAAPRSHEGRKIRSSSRGKSKRLRNRLFIAVAVLILSVVGYLKSDQMMYLIDKDHVSLELDEAKHLIATNQKDKFMRYLQLNIEQAVSRATKDSDGYHRWIPILRAYSFWGSGGVTNLNNAAIRGRDRFFAPKNCTKAAWEKRWLKAKDEIYPFIQGEYSSPKVWIRALLWEPQWISWRGNHKGWIVPKNYYSLCSEMALKSFQGVKEELELELPQEYTQVIEERLTAVATGLSMESDQSTESFPSFLGYLNCLDFSASESNTKVCYMPKTRLSLKIKTFLKQYRAVVAFRKLTTLKKKLGPRDLKSLETQIIPNLARSYPITQLNLTAEIRLAKLILLYGGDIQLSKQKVQREFPILDLISAGDSSSSLVPVTGGLAE